MAPDGTHRSSTRVVNGGPILLIHNGRVIEEHLRRTGLTRDDLDEGLRSRGYFEPAEVYDAVLETDGSISVIEDTMSSTDPTTSG